MVNLTHRIDIWSNGAITPDPSTEFHFWVMPEYLLPKHPHYPIRQAASDLSGAPDVFRTGHFKNPESYRSAPMGEEWQKFNADLMSLARFGKSFLELTDSQKGFIGEAFTSTFGNQTAFCNRTGFEGGTPRANFVARRDLDAELPRLHPLICGTDSITGTKVGAMLRIDSWNYLEHPPQANLSILHDTRVRWATIIYRVKVGRSYQIGKFPQLGKAYGVPYAFITFEPTYYYLDCLQEYRGPRRGLYNPEKQFPY